MADTIVIGIRDFGKICSRHFYNKTSFIKEWWDSRDEVTLMPAYDDLENL